MKKNNYKKYNSNVKNGKLSYVVKHGILGWGVPVGIIITIWNYIDEKPQDFTNFIIESLPNLIVYPITGIFFGLIMFKVTKNKISNND
ncbi:hypothetical protein EW093_08540 [Thiospirochaeta perfilievii]|uniref:Sodium:solute symporter n=1 Tax=Thiospirochaeta perfilievii TaxID=252967 RepID=A0A5C1QB56_9SPIO|nr:hypothetical protein [Thiospirochaeta perfilievii]QEN04751.1 hypothetical protein EW093_08540 [Thiospirochaeta perfilievii]